MALTFERSTRCGVLLLVVLRAFVTAASQCDRTFEEFAALHHKEATPYTSDDQMVYFLHVPRTAGRTFASCFLKLGTPSSRRCPKAYDHLRINVSQPNCYLLSSHDDFSVVSMLPENVAVLTHLRDPVDRFLSAYEFAIEVAARSAFRPPFFKKRPAKIATEDVWPWSYLIPFFAADIFKRNQELKKLPEPAGGHWFRVKHPDGEVYYHNKVLNVSKYNLTAEEEASLLPELDSYNNPLVMSLEDFTHHPVAKELLHNGQTMQVLGISNYSHFGDAAPVRQCIWDDPPVQNKLMAMAKARIQRFLHIGVTDRLADSAAAAGVGMRFDLTGPAYGGQDEDAIAGFPPRPPMSVTQADLPLLGQAARQARLDLQSAQKELFRATQVHQAPEEVQRLKDSVASRRMALRNSQEALLAARNKLSNVSAPPVEEGLLLRPVDPKNPNHLISGLKLGEEFNRCAWRAQSKNLQRRDGALWSLTMPDGRFMKYSRSERKKISQSLLDQIRQLNLLDTELHQTGTKILDSNRQRWAEEGLLQNIPPFTPPKSKEKGERFKYHKPKPDAGEAVPAGELR